MRALSALSRLSITKALGVALALSPLACSDALPPLPSDLSITPNTGVVGARTPVTIRGKNLTEFVVTDFASPSKSTRGITVRIGGLDLLEARLVERDTVTGLAPDLLKTGTFELTVLDGAGRAVSLPGAFTVRPASCEALNAEGPTDCAICNAAPGCACDANSRCVARCGDGIILDAELCDDQGVAAGDGCSPTCLVEDGFSCGGEPSVCTPVCGDGRVLGNEGCDDGARLPGDGCDSNCAVERGFDCSLLMTGTSTCTTVCGDRIRAGDEGCDDGAQQPGDGCSASCGIEVGFECTATDPSVCSPICGDGLILGGEACDDRDTVAGDGCNAECQREAGFDCTGAPSVCVPNCGDGLVIAGLEGCDDMNQGTGDGCADCEVEAGYSCTGQPSVCALGCGDGTLGASEGCDDGDLVSGDGCSGACVLEAGWTCPMAGQDCVPVCGDQRVVGPEVCDDGGMVDGDGCSAMCSAIEPGWTCPPTGGACAPTCGDGQVVGPEACDDGGTAAGDGCDATCAMVENGWTCPPAGGACTETCGDSLRVGDETCDDGGVTPGDGCSATCLAEVGWTCPASGACSPTCGDGRLRGAEACDDNGVMDGDGCSAMCTVEPGFACTGAPSVCVEVCGNGVLDPGETCDDGARLGADGCDVNCAVEMGFTCIRAPSRCFANATTAFVDDTGASCPLGVGMGTPADPYCTLAEGIASPLAVVLVRTGTYAESLTVARTLEIVVEDGARVAGVGVAVPALSVTSSAVLSLTGLTLVGGSTRVVVDGAELRMREATIGPSPLGVGIEVTNGATLALDRSRVTGNGGGGLVLDALGRHTVTNAVFALNGSATTAFGGVHVRAQGAGSVFANNTVVDNLSRGLAGDSAGVLCDVATPIVNTIVFGNVSGLVPGSVSSSCAPTYSDLVPSAAGTGNISVDPLLDGAYRLTAGSPCINAADPTGVRPTGPAPTYDLDGEPRPAGGRVDIGADEAG